MAADHQAFKADLHVMTAELQAATADLQTVTAVLLADTCRSGPLKVRGTHAAALTPSWG